MIIPYQSRWPKIHETAFVAPSADLIGDVELGAHSSVWFQVVIRGDVNFIRIGSRTNIQDHSMLHVTWEKYSLTIGDEVTIGHRAMIHGCKIGNRVLIGMGAILLDGCEIGENSVIGAGSLVTQGKKIPPRSLVMGVPGKVVRELTQEEIDYLPISAQNYVRDSANYKAFVPGPKKLGVDDQDLESFDFDHPAGR